MHMAIHQARQQQIPAQIQHLAGRGRRGIGGQDGGNLPGMAVLFYNRYAEIYNTILVLVGE